MDKRIERSARWFILLLPLLLAAGAGNVAAQSVLDQIKSAADKLLQQQQQQQPPQSQQTRSSPTAAPVTLDDLKAAAPQAPPAAIDWKKMPDVVGVHLGMPPEEAMAVLKRNYPKNQVRNYYVPPAPMPTGSGDISVNLDGRDEPFGDRITVQLTRPPNVEMVFDVTRLAQRQNVNRGTLLAALRQKYGKETIADAGGESGGATTDDNRIRDLWWIFDEQGRPARPPGDGPLALRCNVPHAGGSIDSMARRRQSPWCESSHIAVRAQLGGGEIIETLSVDMIHLPLGLSAARATLAQRDAVVAKRRQEEIERSKQAKPKL